MARVKSYPLLRKMSENLDKVLRESGVPVTRIKPGKEPQAANALVISFVPKRVSENSAKY